MEYNKSFRPEIHYDPIQKEGKDKDNVQQNHCIRLFKKGKHCRCLDMCVDLDISTYLINMYTHIHACTLYFRMCSKVCDPGASGGGGQSVKRWLLFRLGS